MLFEPQRFNCKHKHLTKLKMSNGTYECDTCEKQFVIIPAKNEPIIMPHFPNQKPHRQRPPRHFPDFPRSPDFNKYF